MGNAAQTQLLMIRKRIRGAPWTLVSVSDLLLDEDKRDKYVVKDVTAFWCNL